MPFHPGVLRCFAASSEDFPRGLHLKMEKFSEKLTTFVETSKKYAEFLPAKHSQHILNDEAIHKFGNMFTSISAADVEIKMAKRLEVNLM
jgi:hypothetical protein